MDMVAVSNTTNRIRATTRAIPAVDALMEASISRETMVVSNKETRANVLNRASKAVIINRTVVVIKIQEDAVAVVQVASQVHP
jgi:hypothetical protein